MSVIWMQSEIDGTYKGERCVGSLANVPASVAADLVASLNEEFADMGLSLRVWAE